MDCRLSHSSRRAPVAGRSSANKSKAWPGADGRPGGMAGLGATSVSHPLPRTCRGRNQRPLLLPRFARDKCECIVNRNEQLPCRGNVLMTVPDELLTLGEASRSTFHLIDQHNQRAPILPFSFAKLGTQWAGPRQSRS
jgi:hypothetical protein